MGESLNGVQIAAQKLRSLSHSTASVATSSTEIAAANNAREYLLIVNDSDTTIYLKVGATAATNEGIRLNANGGSFEMSRQNGNLDTSAVNGIHGGSGTKTMLVSEA